MFNKPFKIKANSQLKGSERRKLRSEILKSFPHLSEDELVNVMPHKEVMSSIKLLTHNGESVTVYTVQKLPLVFVHEGVLYPTVYMLWKFPDLLPVFTTWPQVFPKLSSGADLMLPGVVLREAVHLHSYGKLEKGARAVINLTSNKAPVAVGVTALSSFDMYMAAKRGKAIKVYHILGDHLWALGTTLTIPELGPPQGFENDEEKAEGVQEGEEEEEKEGDDAVNGEDEKEEAATKNPSEDKVELEVPESGACGYTPLAENHEDAAVSQLGECLQSVAVDENLEESEENMNEVHKVSDISASCTNNIQKEMDELLLYCFLKAWKTSAKKVEFPILTSNFYRLHMLPACPVGESVDLKKSSYKKLSKFLNAMENASILKVKELTKGVESIMSVDYGHSMLKEFVDTKRIPEAVSKQEDISKKDLKPEIMEMYNVTAAVLPVVSCQGCRKGDSLSVADIRKIVTEYVKSNNLQSTTNKRMVNLNPLLKTVLQCPDADSIKWEDLMTKFLGQMTNSYQITFAGESTVAAKGKLKTIDIQIGKRTGNKKVTLVNNLELYKINLQEFARECQHGAAASTSINTIPGMKSRQVLIQGNQVLFVAKLLTEKYKIPIKYIKGLENAPKTRK